MSRFNPHRPNNAALFDAVQNWCENCLIGDGSVFVASEAYWVPRLFTELNSNFVENLDDGTDTYLEKLQRQLGAGSDEAKRLMAEIDWIVTLFSSNIGQDKKRSNIGEIWSWSGEELDLANPMLLDDVLVGFGSTGIGYNTNKWREITFAIVALGAFKSKDFGERQDILQDSRGFATWLDQQPDASNRQFRHILLHLLFPDDFERITSKKDKFQVLFGFEMVTKKDQRQLSLLEIDQKLKELRGRLETEAGEPIDFYWGDIMETWKVSEDSAESAGPIEGLTARGATHFLALCLAQSGEPHIALGFSTQTTAFEAIASKFGTKSNTVKNNRDSFDRLTSSDRVGWKTPLRPALQSIWDRYGDMGRDEILAKGVEILGAEWDEKVMSEKKEEVAANSSLDIFGINNEDDNLIKIREPYLGSAITFSNTHARNTDAWFVLTGEQLSRALRDILDNVSAFSPTYDEATWRNLFKTHLSDDVARYMGAVQTLPLFEVLSKAIHYSGSEDGRTQKTIDLTPASLERAIAAIDSLSVSGQMANELPIAEVQGKPAERGQNMIYYGAPGTGKSHSVDEFVGEENVVRTVFHPDTQNSDFFGCLKPRMDSNRVVYGFAPGPLSVALRAAYKDPAHQHYLVIEELNRAPAAAVFGELFQLLDRKSTGKGRYKVDFPNSESKDWFNEDGQLVDKLSMPSNLSILATMNSADHGVYPLDTAFRRRWEQQYLPLEGENCPEGTVEYVGSDGSVKLIDWGLFVRSLNDFLTERLGTAEDRLLGQWFVQAEELNSTIPTKILLYLWDDLLRHEGRERVFATTIKTFGNLDRAISRKSVIFSPDLLVALEQHEVISENPTIPAELNEPEEILDGPDA